MPRHNNRNHQAESFYRMQEHPATELAEALGLPAADRVSYDYSKTLELKERLIEVCVRCVIRCGLPDQARKHVGDAIGAPAEPLLRYPHREIPLDPRWEALANALRFPSPGDFPLVQLHVLSAQQLAAIKASLPSLLEDFDLQRRPRHDPAHSPLFRPIRCEMGDQLLDKVAQIQAYGDSDISPEGTNRSIARNMHRQMRIYMELGPEWTLVNSFESLALNSYTRPSPASKPSPERPSVGTTLEAPLHASRRNLTGQEPADAPPALIGLRWTWTTHDGKHLPSAWGGPQQGPWGRWEPQFPDTDKPNTSLFGHSSVYFGLDLDSNTFRDKPTRKLLQILHELRKDFEETRRTARREGYCSVGFEAKLTARLIKDQDKALDSLIKRNNA